MLPTKLASAFQSRAAIPASPRPSSFIPQVYKHRVVSWLTLRPLRIGQALGFFSSLRGFEHACQDARSSLLTSKCPKRAINLDTSLDNFLNLKIILPLIASLVGLSARGEGYLVVRGNIWLARSDDRFMCLGRCDTAQVLVKEDNRA